MGSATSIVYLFATEAPFIGIEHIGLKPDEYGFLNFIPPIGMIVGSLLVNFLAGRKYTMSLLSFAIIFAFISAVTMLLLFLFGKITLWSLSIPMPFIYMGTFFVYSNVAGIAMSHAKDKSNASAVMNFINMGVSVMAVFIIELLPSQNLYILPLFFIVCCLLMLILNFSLLGLLKKT